MLYKSAFTANLSMKEIGISGQVMHNKSVDERDSQVRYNKSHMKLYVGMCTLTDIAYM